jgi:glycosyltransferase involved in cell wall biosynthesis
VRRRLHAVVSAYAPWEFGGGAERVAWNEARRLAERHPVVFLHTGGPLPPRRRAGAAAAPVREPPQGFPRGGSGEPGRFPRSSSAPQRFPRGSPEAPRSFPRGSPEAPHHERPRPEAPAPITTARIGGWLRRLHDPRTGARTPIGKAAFHALLPFNPVVFAEALSTFRRLRPEVVHTHNLVGLSPSVWLAARLAGARVVHTHHDLSLLCQRATMTRRDGRPCEERTATCLVCRATRPAKRAQTTALDRERFPSGWLRDRLGRRGEIAPPFVPRTAAPADPPDEFRALFLGRLVPAKGIETLLEAAAGAKVRLTVAGDGPLENRVREAPSVTYSGYVDEEEKARLLAEASVLVIPSIGPEAAPLVFFEALAAGVPTIVSDIGGLTELADLGAAILVPPGDPDALAYVFRDLAADPARLAKLRNAAGERRAAYYEQS